MVTGATGFLGLYLVNELSGRGGTARCWYRIGTGRMQLHSGVNLLS